MLEHLARRDPEAAVKGARLIDSPSPCRSPITSGLVTVPDRHSSYTSPPTSSVSLFATVT
ncbi:MAG TPA: hypothetical protein VHC67_05515 [Gaiellaceae bacterium]|nr:hypothetical protein [Gaiellaceae bacterium]